MKGLHINGQTVDDVETQRTGREALFGFVRILLLIDLAFAVGFLLDFALGHPVPFNYQIINLDGEENIPAWYSSGQLLVLALLMGVLGVLEARSRSRGSWVLIALSALFLAMSLDESVQFHELFGVASDALYPSGSREGSILSYTGLWVVLLGPPFLLVVGLLSRSLVRSFRVPTRVVRIYIAGILTYGTAAIGIESLANFTSGDALFLVVGITVEEVGEMLGITLLIWATLEMMVARGVSLRMRSTADTE